MSGDAVNMWISNVLTGICRSLNGDRRVFWGRTMRSTVGISKWALRTYTAEGESGGKAESEWCDSRQDPSLSAHPCSYAATQPGSSVDSSSVHLGCWEVRSEE